VCIRFTNHEGFFSAPPAEATVARSAPSTMKSTGFVLGFPLFDPVVVRSIIGAFCIRAATLPPEARYRNMTTEFIMRTALTIFL
jgi:hypothetical protein